MISRSLVFKMRILTLTAGFLVCSNLVVAQKQTNDPGPISLEQFQSSTRHWYNISDAKNIIQPRKSQPRYSANQFVKIADNMLLYQRNNGGWIKNYDMQAILTTSQEDSIRSSKNILHTTFDNSTTYSHIEYLAKVYTITQTGKYKEACLNGINFILSAQYENGGWPQYFPLEKDDYSRYITFNDGAYIGIMKLFKDILDNQPYYSFMDDGLRIKIKASFDIGVACILKCQIKEKKGYTAWCQQHSETDFRPVWARAFEPPSICNKESAEITLFLMGLKNPDKKIVKSIKNAVKWFEASKIIGIREREVPAPEVHYGLRESKSDKTIVNDPKAPPIWTRFYELGTHIPMFCNRDSKIVYSLVEVERERRSGYGWYTYDPQQVLDKYQEWKNSLKNKGNY